jgi:hypothetical protein
MGFFGRKRQEPPPRQAREYATSREYRMFAMMEDRPLNWYEKTARFSGRILTANPPKGSEREISGAVSFTGLRVSPQQVMSLTVMTIVAFLIMGVAVAVSGITKGIFLPIGGIAMVIFGFLLGYYFFKYPSNLLKEMRIRASSQVVLAVLYMVVSMRISPNLERALRFAAANVSGPLAWDMRKLLWDLEMKKYYSASDAIDAYMAKWKPENEEFAEALRLIRDATTQPANKTNIILDESLNVVLEGSKTRMKHYVQELKLPVMVIHMMGIVLPVLGSIMAPLVAVFMADMIQAWHFILGYDIALPIIIVWFINNTLRKRPVTFSPSAGAAHPNLPKRGHVLVKGRSIPCIAIALAVLLGAVTYPVLYFAEDPGARLLGTGEGGIFSLAMAGLIIMGIGMSMGVYFYLSTFQRKDIQSEIRSVENDFELALFQLGNRMSAGVPTEVAIAKAMDDVKDLKIADMFRLTLRNMKSLGMTFELALFDQKYGSLLYYPSELIRNVMKAVVDTAKKGVRYASDSMFRISKYMKNIRETQEYMRELLEETVSSMRFQAYMLTPMVTALVVSMASIIITVLSRLGEYVKDLGLGQSVGLPDITVAFNAESAISPELFQLIVGVYLIEVLVILAMFMTKISEGESKTSQWYAASKMLFTGLIIHYLIVLFASTIFSQFIEQALGTLGIM